MPEYFVSSGKGGESHSRDWALELSFGTLHQCDDVINIEVYVGEAIQDVRWTRICLQDIGYGTVPKNRERRADYGVGPVHQRLREGTGELRRVKPFHWQYYIDAYDDTIVISF